MPLVILSTTKKDGQRPRKPHPVDVRIGLRIKLRRKMLGLSQAKLAAAVGLAAGQVDSLERGTVHLTARQVYELSRLMNVPVIFFFEEVSGGRGRRMTAVGSSRSVADRQRRLGSALRLLLAVVDLADRDGGIDEGHYEAAKKSARGALHNAAVTSEGASD